MPHKSKKPADLDEIHFVTTVPVKIVVKYGGVVPDIKRWFVDRVIVLDEAGGDTDIVEVLPVRDDSELTPLDAGQQKPRRDDGDIRMEFADIVGQIHSILEDNDAGKSRVALDPEDVAALHGIADRLGAMPGVLSLNSPIG